MPEMISCMLSGKHVAATATRDAAELALAGGDVDPVAVVQVQDCGRGDGWLGLRGLAVEGRGGEHADAHQHAGIVNLDADLGGVDLRDRERRRCR